MQEDALHAYPYYIYTFSEAQESQRPESRPQIKDQAVKEVDILGIDFLYNRYG